jgi:hypothetical protein
MLNRLRLTESFTEADFQVATGLPFDQVRDAAAQAVELGLMETRENEWWATYRGHTYLNDLQRLFLPEPNETRPAHSDHR